MFVLLLALIPYIVWYVLRSKKSQPAMKMPEVAKYRYVPRTWRMYLMHMPFLLRNILLALVVIILARPQSKNTWSDTDVEGVDIMDGLQPVGGVHFFRFQLCELFCHDELLGSDKRQNQ